jgi:hypothetical protein
VRACQLGRVGTAGGPPAAVSAVLAIGAGGCQAFAFESKKSAALFNASWTEDLPSSAF